MRGHPTWRVNRLAVVGITILLMAILSVIIFNFLIGALFEFMICITVLWVDIAILVILYKFTKSFPLFFAFDDDNIFYKNVLRTKMLEFKDIKWVEIGNHKRNMYIYKNEDDKFFEIEIRDICESMKVLENLKRNNVKIKEI
jgi:hypothetical protein